MTLFLKSDQPIAFLIVIGVFGIILFIAYYFNSKRVILRVLSKTPLKSMKNLNSNEFVKIQGKALHANTPLKAPYSQRECVFYSMKIMQKKSNGKSSHWKTLVHEEKFQDFFIENEGDLVLIKPSKSPLNYITYLVSDKEVNSGTFNDPSPAFETFLKKYQIDPSTWLGFNKTLKYEEGIISIGEPVTVTGKVVWKSLSEPIPEYPYTKIPQLEPDGKQRIIITDLIEAFDSE